jgi:hypothetical protein
MGNVNCSQLCGPSGREGLAIDNSEIDGTPMRPAVLATEEQESKSVVKKSVMTTTPKANLDLFARKIVSIDKRFTVLKFKRVLKRWRGAAASVKSVSQDPDFDERLKRLGNFVSDDDMRRQTKEAVLVLEKQLGPIDSDSKAQKGLVVKGPFKYNSDRSIYKGSWSQDVKKQGYGILVKEDGSKYEGNWENDEQSGFGRYFDNKGNYFVGKFYTLIQVTGETAKPTVRVCCVSIDLSSKEIGKTTSRSERVLKPSMTDPAMKASTRRDVNTDKASSHGPISHATMVNSRTE